MANILVVDDDKVQLKVLEATLIKAGHSVLTVEDGRLAMEKLDVELFDMIITDINMPGGLSGYNLISMIRSNQKLKDLPAIFLTGRRDKEDVVKALNAGIDDYIVKPFEADLLYTKIESLLNKKASVHNFADCPTKVKATFPFELEIVSVSEQGISIVSPLPFPLNFKLKFECELFEQIDLNNPTMRVAHCSPTTNHPKMFSVKANFVGLDEVELQKVRNWAVSNGAKAKKVS